MVGYVKDVQEVRKMNKDKFTIICERCEHTWTQEVNGFDEVNWDCPICKQQDRTAMLKYVPGNPEFYNRKITMGKGGSLHA